MRRPWSLRLQLGASAAVVALVPALLVSGVAAWLGGRYVRDQVAARNEGLAEAVSGEVDEFLQGQLIQVEEVAMASRHRGLELDEVGHLMHFNLGANPAMQRLLLLDRGGQVIYGLPKSEDLVGTDLSGEPFVREAVASGQPTWSSPTMSLSTGRPAVSLVVPTLGGMAIGYLDLSAIQEVAARTSMARGAVAAVVARDGTLIAHADPRLVAEQVNANDVPLVRQGLAGREATAEFEQGGERWLGSVRRVPSTGWLVMVAEPEALAHAPVRHLQRVMVAAFALAAAAAALLGVLMARRLVAPIEALSSAARQVAGGEHDRALPGHGAASCREVDELARSFERMVAAVRSREEALGRSQMQLYHAQKLEAVGRLAGGVAHDFNNLLTAIVGFASLLKEEMRPDDPERGTVDAILQSAHRGAHLTKSLLAYSRKQVLQRRPVDVAEVIRGVERLLHRVIGEDVELRLELPAGPLVAVADPSQLEQVLLNLCTNARDAMPSGGRLRIVAGRAPATEGAGGGPARPASVAITVIDTGRGMAPEELERIFEPFFTTKEPGKGTGLGLAIVYGIARQHGGDVEVESEPGRGTTMRVLLPAHEGPADAPPAPAPVRSAPRGRETVLLAEDEPLVREALRRALAGAGYEVIVAADGDEAVARFEAHRDRIAACVLDVVMPRRNGLEAAEAITRACPGLPVLLASGYAADALEERGLLPAEATFITKPVTPADLLATLRKRLDEASSARARPATAAPTRR
ncbi:MAG: ATP-binding protein [Anaeromyxobacter sp.]